MNKQKQQMYKMLASLMSGEDLDIVFDARMSSEHANFHLKDRVIRIAPLAPEQEHLTTGLVIHETAHAIYTVGDAPMNRILNIVEDGYIERMISKRYKGAKTHLKEVFDAFFNEPTPQGSLIIDILNVMNYNCKGIKYGKTVTYPDQVSVEDVEWFRDAVEMTTIPSYDDRAVLANEVKERLLKYGTADEIPEKYSYGLIDDPDGLLDALEKFLEDNNELLNDHHEKFITMDDDDFEDFEDTWRPRIHAEMATPDILNQISKILDINNIDEVDEYLTPDFKREMIAARKRATTMYQRFLIKRNAMTSQKIQYHKSGSIDIKRLVNYQTTDDIFKRNEMRPVGTNHGVVMMLDWSISMSGIIKEVWKRLAEFAEFARLADIHLIAYAFTTSSASIVMDRCRGKDFPTSCVHSSKFIKIIDTNENKNIMESLHKFYDLVNGVGPEEYNMSCTNINEAYTFARYQMKKVSAQNKTIMMITDGDDDYWSVFISGDQVSTGKEIIPRFMGSEISSQDTPIRKAALQTQIEYMELNGVKSAGIYLSSSKSVDESIEKTGKMIYNGRYLVWTDVNNNTNRENKFINTIVDLIL